jgi:hypothetical protein
MREVWRAGFHGILHGVRVRSEIVTGTKEVLLRGRELDKPFSLFTGTAYEFILKIFTCGKLEVEDVHFHTDSAVLLPDYEGDAPPSDEEKKEKITAFTLLAVCFRHAQEHPERKMLLAGHTDTRAGSAYNFTLSQLRAENVLALLQGDRSGWAANCQNRHKVKDYQRILKWISRDWGWNCDPGDVDGNDGDIMGECHL